MMQVIPSFPVADTRMDNWDTEHGGFFSLVEALCSFAAAGRVFGFGGMSVVRSDRSGMGWGWMLAVLWWVAVGPPMGFPQTAKTRSGLSE